MRPALTRLPALCRALVAVAALAGLSAPLSATSYMMITDTALTDQAAAIAEVKVLSSEASPDGERVATDYLVEVERVVKGFVAGSSLIVRVIGGERPDGTSLHVWGAPRFAPGEKALLFLRPNEDGSFGILHLMLGAFHRFELSGKAYALRELEEATEILNPFTGKALSDERLPRDYEAFVDWLAAYAEGSRRPADYLVSGPPEKLRSIADKFSLLRDRTVDRNLRWFEFDSGGSVEWRAHQSGQAGVPGGGFGAFQAALAAWNVDPSTPINLVYRGTTAATGGFDDNGDGLNTILFNDPNAEIEGTFECASGGVLAIGGPRYDWDARGTFNGREYLRILEAEIISNDGISCYLIESGNPARTAEEIFGHELGHTLGLGHSCGDGSTPGCATRPELDDALMRARAHGDGRGARLAQDDLAGSRSLYRQTSGGGGGGGGGPAAPANLVAVLDGLDAQLSWQDSAANELGYRVYRRTGNGAFTRLAELPAGTVSYLDRDLAASTSYGYQVGAFNNQGEKKSAVVGVTTPAVTPITVAVDAPSGPITAGEPFTLTATFTGPGESADWTFGGNTAGVSQEPCDAGRFCATHIFRAAGTYTVAIDVLGDLGQTAEGSRTVTVIGSPAAFTTEESLIQSVIFGPRGDTGTFKSNCWVHNAGDEAALVEISYLLRGSSNPAPETRELVVDGGSSVLLENLVSRLFGETNSQGALALAYHAPGGDPSPDVRTVCRSFVELPGSAASFGLFVPENVASTWTAEPKVAAGVLEGGGFASNVQAFNVDASGGTVFVEVLDANGLALGPPAGLALGGRSIRSRPLAQLYPGAGSRPGPFTARFTSTGIRFVASVTLLELASEDQIFVNAAPADTANPVFVPRISRAQGQFNAFLVSQLIAKNNSAEATTLEIQLWKRGEANLAPQTVTRVIPGSGVLVVGDVIQDLFGLAEGAGALRISWSNADNLAPRIQTYSFNQSQGGQGARFGMLVDSRPAASATAAAGHDFGAEQSALFRADFGLLNLGTGGTQVKAVLREADGDVRATATLILQPQQHLERNVAGIFQNVAIGEGRNWTVETEVLAGGPILSYLANINASGDIFFVPGRPKE